MAASAVEIVLYRDPKYSGPSITLTRSAYDFKSVNFDNTASSIDIKRGVWTVYSDPNFGGRSLILSPGKYDIGYLSSNIGNDTISSIRPTEVILYRDYDFTGYSVRVAEQVSSLGPLSMDNTVSCIEVTAGECTVYIDPNYQGKSATLKMGRYDQNDIRSMIGNDVISSLRLRTSSDS